MRLVIDASIAVEYLLKTPLGSRAAPTIEAAALVAPQLLDAEVLAVLTADGPLSRMPPVGVVVQNMRGV